MSARGLCLIGQVFVDFVERQGAPPIMRLGGIMHAARTLWSMGLSFAFAYTAPAYLKQDAESWAKRYGASHVQQIGTIERCPNVVVIGDGKEVGNQHYEYLLRDASECRFHEEAFAQLMRANEFTDILIFPGGFPLVPILTEINSCTADVFADINFVGENFSDLFALRRNFASLIFSTSSDLFLKVFGGDPIRAVDEFGKHADSVLLKENRGGSRLFGRGPDKCLPVPAQTRPILHSVGVGDCFNSVFVGQRRAHGDEAALAYASFASGEYASYFDDSKLEQSIKTVMSLDPEEIKLFKGVELPWEIRPKINVYLAAPDFDHVDTTPLDRLADALAYHNFSPRRPVREHGQARLDDPRIKKASLAEADLGLLATCKILVAVLLYDDPGTLIEIGIAFERGIAVIVFDPHNTAKNLMLTELPVLVSSDLDSIVSEVFIQAAKLIDDGK